MAYSDYDRDDQEQRNMDEEVLRRLDSERFRDYSPWGPQKDGME